MVPYSFFGLASPITLSASHKACDQMSFVCVTRHSQTRSMPGAGKSEGTGGRMGAVNRVMIGPAGTVDLHVVITASKQWGGWEGASTALFDQC